MKNVFFAISLITIGLAITSCNNPKTGENTVAETVHEAIDSNTIQVYYFHGSIRCHTCVSVGDSTAHYLETLFPEELGSEKIIFKTINIDKNEREDLITKYEIYGQTMLFIKGDKVLNETEDAFKYVTTSPEKWKATVENSIISLQS